MSNDDDYDSSNGNESGESIVYESYAGTGGGAGVEGTFVPSDLPDIDSTPLPTDPPGFNFVESEELVRKALLVVQDFHTRYTADRGDLEDLWRDIDYMWKCARNSAKRDAKTNKNDENRESTTHAKTGSTLFYKQVTRLSTQTLSVLFARPDPFRYRPLYADGSFLKEEEGKALADQHTALARWNNINDGFERKMIEGLTLLNKYGNLPVGLCWNRKVGSRWMKTPIRGEQSAPTEIPPIVGYELVKRDHIINNHLSLMFMPNENFYADRHIGDMQKQNCVMTRTLSNYNDFYEGQRAGYYDNVDEIKEVQIYRGEYDQNLHSDKMLNLGMGAGDDTQTGQFEQWDVWVRLPIDEMTGEWNEKTIVPKLYWLTFVGALRGGTPVCIRFERNPDPSDMIPWMMWHQLPDDGDNLYHLAGAQIIMSNYDELTTAKNQAIDNRTLHNRKPLKAVYGEVYSDDIKFGAGKVINVERMDSIGEFQISDITGTIMANISYLEEDANRAMNTDRPIEGIPLGQRTSATEAANVYEQSRMPHLIHARYQLGQVLRFYGEHLPRYWQLFALPGQVLEISGENERTEVKADQLFGDYEVVIDVVEEAGNDSIRQQSIDMALMQFTQNPTFAQYMDIPNLLKEWFKSKRWSGASRFIKEPKSFDAERVARAENQMMVEVANPVYIEPSPDENKAAHLKVHEMYLAQFSQIANADEQYPGLPLLRQHIEMTRMALQAEQPQMAAPTMVPPEMGQTAGQVQGQQIAAQAGAAAQMGLPVG
jgi:hypothetical protein